jgi:hypothetical protein
MTEDSSRFPSPPYDPELLAEFQAGNLDAATAAHVRAHIAEDADAQATLVALARVRDELHALGDTEDVADHNTDVDDAPPPDWVRARTQETLAAIAAETTPHPAMRRPNKRNERKWRGAGPRTYAILSAAAILIVVVVTAVIALRPSQPTDSVEARPSAPSSNLSVPAPSSTLDRAAALSVLGRTDGSPFPSTDALRRCTAANGIPATTPVLGSGPVTVDGTQQVVILLGTGVAGRFLALVVGPDCDTGNPATVSRTTIGG